MRSLAVVAVVMLLGCGTKTGGHDMSGAGRDLAGVSATADLMSLPAGDMIHPRAGISCGSQQCGASSQYCCTGDEGVTGTCNNTNNLNCADLFFYCDGPEDCPPALGECCIVNGSANCVTPGECAQMQGNLLCHDGTQCEGTGNCCPAPKGPYALCLAQACP
jgi:hypothetical protein